jgi:hypothetical protein
MDENNAEFASEAQDPRVGQATKIARYGIVLSLLFALLSIGSLLSTSNSEPANSSGGWSSQDSLDDSEAGYSDGSWAPIGYDVWESDSNVAWRWAVKDNCDEYACLTAQFISRNGCPGGFYAAVNWLDAGEAVISYDNSTLPALYAMQVAKMRFDDREGTSETGQIAEIKCY